MLFIYLYHGDLYPDLWKSDPYFRSADRGQTIWVSCSYHVVVQEAF